MSRNKVLGIALVLSLGLGLYLFLGVNKSSTAFISTEETSNSAEEVASSSESDLSESEVKSYISKNISSAKPTDANISQLLSYCAQAKENDWLDLDQMLSYGKLKIETSPAPMEGIFILREILEKDSNHVATIETFGEMSIRSGQLDKAKKRYQKLLSLQPENEEYRSQLKALCEQLGDSDCF
ncbi:MAG: tetratricopeptide (TPR) repeat protein [Bacteroidia bacterium]|jgi:tetratricopeptide (TPR) repeat protein